MSNLKDARAQITHITLSDGVERELKFTLNAMADMEDRYGSVEKAFEALEANSMKAARFVLWCGLNHCDNPLSEKQVGDLIDIRCMKEIVEKLGEAVAANMPEEDEALPNA